MNRSTVSAEKMPWKLRSERREPLLQVPAGDQVDLELSQLRGHHAVGYRLEPEPREARS
jgi:hypothetical protein